MRKARKVCKFVFFLILREGDLRLKHVTAC